MGLLNILFALEASGQESKPTLNAASLDQALAFIAKPKMSAPNCPDLKPKKKNEEIILESICRAPNSKDKQPALDSKNPSRLVYVATDPNQIPKEFAERIPLQSFEVSEKRPLYLAFAMDNDNVLLGAAKSGDDMGYTHSVMMDIGGTSKSGISFGGSFYTGLYTKEKEVYYNSDGKPSVTKPKFGYLFRGTFYENGQVPEYPKLEGKSPSEQQNIIKEWYEEPWVSAVETQAIDGQKVYEEIRSPYESGWNEVPSSDRDPISGKKNQVFQEDTVVKLFANNHQQGKWYLWSAEAGFMGINHNVFQKGLASGIQDSWHHALKDTVKVLGNDAKNVPLYNYVSSGEAARFGLVMAGSLGVQKDLYQGQNCLINVNAMVSEKWSNLKEANLTSITAGIRSTHLIGKDKKRSITLNAGATYQRNERQAGTSLNAGIRYTGKRVAIFNSFQKPLNAGPSTSQYNDTDIIHRMGLIIPIGQNKNVNFKPSF